MEEKHPQFQTTMHYPDIPTPAENSEPLDTNSIIILSTMGSTILTRTPCRIFFQAFRETSGIAPATFRLRDGIDVSGKALEPISLAPNESTRDPFGEQGLQFKNGIYFEYLTGTFEGAIIIATETDYRNQTQNVHLKNFHTHQD